MQLTKMIHALGPVLSAVVAACLVILGMLIIVYPELLGWIIGIGCLLGGVALFAFLSFRGSRFEA